MTLDDLLAGYGTSLGGKPFAIDAQGVCELAFGERRIVIEPVPGEATAQLWAVLGRLPPRHGRPGLYERLLAANLFGSATAGATLAIDREREEVLLCRGFEPSRLDVHTFAALIRGFADMAELWAREVAQPSEAASGGAPRARVDEFAIRV